MLRAMKSWFLLSYADVVLVLETNETYQGTFVAFHRRHAPCEISRFGRLHNHAQSPIWMVISISESKLNTWGKIPYKRFSGPSPCVSQGRIE